MKANKRERVAIEKQKNSSAILGGLSAICDRVNNTNNEPYTTK